MLVEAAGRSTPPPAPPMATATAPVTAPAAAAQSASAEGGTEAATPTQPATPVLRVDAPTQDIRRQSLSESDDNEERPKKLSRADRGKAKLQQCMEMAAASQQELQR
eukprot:scpid100632/ scgid29158/ 